MKVNRMKVFFVVCAFLVLAACSHKVNMVEILFIIWF